jgi:hypothetical protein
MDTDWRELLQEKVRQVKDGGGPPPEGETILVRVRLDKPKFEPFVAVLGRLNDRPFGEAPAGTLELRSLIWGEDGEGTLWFHFHREPPPEFSPSYALPRPRNASGKSPRTISGVDFNALPGLVFPLEREQLNAMIEGKRLDAVVPVPPDIVITQGDWVTFIEAKADPFGNPVNIPGGSSLSVRIKRARDEHHAWAGQKLFYVAWDPDEVPHGVSLEAEPAGHGQGPRRHDG